MLDVETKWLRVEEGEEEEEVAPEKEVVEDGEEEGEKMRRKRRMGPKRWHETPIPGPSPKGPGF